MPSSAIYGPDLDRRNDLVYDDEFPTEDDLALSPYHTNTWSTRRTPLAFASTDTRVKPKRQFKVA